MPIKTRTKKFRVTRMKQLIFPQELIINETHVLSRKRRFPSFWIIKEESIPLSKVASIQIMRGMLFSTIIIQNSGGPFPIVVNGLPNDDASEVRRTLETYDQYSRLTLPEDEVHDTEQKSSKLEGLLNVFGSKEKEEIPPVFSEDDFKPWWAEPEENADDDISDFIPELVANEDRETWEIPDDDELAKTPSLSVRKSERNTPDKPKMPEWAKDIVELPTRNKPRA